MKLYIFNPDTDMALANNEENYMPPASARQMAQDLALLPVWYASPGSAVLAPSDYNADYLQMVKRMFSISIQLVTEPELPDYAESRIIPWGWNPAFRKRMLKGGITECMLPTLNDLSKYRMLSSRSHVLSLCRFLECSEAADYICGDHRMIEGNEKGEFTEALVTDFKNGYVFKSLWSGSGKGLRWCRDGLMKSTADWCNRQLAEYGSVMVEPIYNKVGDFAMEFYSDGRGKTRFIGYSRFVTDDKGAYRGNLLVSDMEVEQWLERYVPRQAIVCIRERLQQGLKAIYSKQYTGPLGVDMMVCSEEKGGRHPYAIHPHVEVNVRMTMGIVAHQFYKNFVTPGCEGLFSVEYNPSNKELRAQHEKDTFNYPLVIKDEKLLSGYLPLVPVTPKSQYRAFVCL